MLRLTEIRLPIDHPEARTPRRDPEAARHTAERSDRVLRLPARRRRAQAGRSSSPTRSTWKSGTSARCSSACTGDRHVAPAPDMSYRFVAHARRSDLDARPVVIGTGPCGFFAGLLLAQMGFRPIILERGKAVRERTRDTWGLWRRSVLDPESNVQFGEGGAGTFSDGKLYSQVRDPRHLGRKVLTEFVKAGAPAEILYVAQAAHRDVPAGRDGREPARDDTRAGRRDPVPEQGRGRRDRGRAQCAAWRWRAESASPPITSCSPSATARATRSRCSTTAASTSRPSRSPSAFASSIPSRSSTARATGRNAGHPLARRRGLQARSPLRQRTLGLQLLHVPRRHRRGRHLRSRGASSPTA